VKPVRIVVDQSGYDLLNIGDIAMLQAALHQLRRFWPDAEIGVVTQAPERLSRYCPDTHPIGLAVPASPGRDTVIQSARAAIAQVHKIAAPYGASAPGIGRLMASGLIAEVQQADAVVATGGGYLTDVFWWHGVGVLSVMGLAQRLGIPTAMFGQGIGPLDHALLRRQAALVLPKLDLLTLREGTLGPDLVRRLGVRDERLIVTGDDALSLIQPAEQPQTAVGINVRVAGYSDVSDTVARQIVDATLQVARNRAATVQALPVSRYERDGDLAALRRAVGKDEGPRVSVTDVQTADRLIELAARCRVVVTGSYHAAVFALAQGVPVVCLSGSSYYDGKFLGLSGMFPGGCSLVSVAGSDFRGQVHRALETAWDCSPEQRDSLRVLANQQASAGRDAYARFAELIEARPRRHRGSGLPERGSHP
jgi:colanic acid/amylovoran biosynthesis protein